MQIRPNALGEILGAFAFLLTVTFVPWFSDLATGPRWALLSVGVPLLLLRTAVRPTLGHLLGGLLFAWAALSLTWTPSLYDGLNGLWGLLLMGGIFCLGAQLPSLQPVLIGLGIGFALNSGVTLAQELGWQGVPQIAPPAGLFSNHNVLAYAAAPVLVGLLCERLWLLAALAVPSVVVIMPGGSMSRGPLLVLGAMGALWLWRRHRMGALLVLAIMADCLLWSLLYGTHNDQSQRLAIWADTVDGLTWLGRGVGSFYYAFPEHAERYSTLFVRPAQAHNDYLELLFDLGPVGLILAAAFAATLLAPRPTERAVLLCIAMEAAIDFPLHLPLTVFLGSLAAGCLCGARHSLRHDLATCGRLLRRRVGRRDEYPAGARPA